MHTRIWFRDGTGTGGVVRPSQGRLQRRYIIHDRLVFAAVAAHPNTLTAPDDLPMEETFGNKPVAVVVVLLLLLLLLVLAVLHSMPHAWSRWSRGQARHGHTHAKRALAHVKIITGERAERVSERGPGTWPEARARG